MKLKDIDKAVLVWGELTQDFTSRLKDKLVIVPEQRPYLLGLKKNAPLLKRGRIRFVYCSDNMLGLLFYLKKISKTFIFCKEINDKGIVSCSGSLYAVLLSKLHKVIVEPVLNQQYSLDFTDKNAGSLEGKNFIMEADKENYIIEARDEFIEKELLQ